MLSLCLMVFILSMRGKYSNILKGGFLTDHSEAFNRIVFDAIVYASCVAFV